MVFGIGIVTKVIDVDSSWKLSFEKKVILYWFAINNNNKKVILIVINNNQITINSHPYPQIAPEKLPLVPADNPRQVMSLPSR